MCFACRDPSGEECGGGVVDQRAAAGGNLMQGPGAEALPGKPSIERFDAERQATVRHQR